MDRANHQQSGMLSIRRSRLIEVLYTLRVTINSSIYVDLPITLINFLSIDPPPMPGDAVLKPQPSIQHRVTAPARCVRPQASRMLSEESCNSSTNMAKASSTTLSLDDLLQAGRIRAEAEGVGEEAREKARPLSMGSQYTIEKGNIQFEGPSAMLHVGTQPKVIPIRPKGGRMMSYLSNRSQSETSSIEADEQDKSFLAARRAQGRQLSLAAIGRAIDRAAAADAAEDDVITPGKESLDGEYFPAQTPMEEVYPMMGETSDEVDKLEQRTPRMQSNSFAHQDRGITEKREHDVIEERPEEEAAEIEQETPVQDAEVEAGNETILGDLVGVHTIEDMIEHSDALAGEYGGYDYADEIEDGDESFSTTGLVQEPPSLQQLPPSTEDSRRSLELSGATRQQYVAQSRSISGSFATDGESEEGHVYEAVKRNVSMRLPLRILPFNGSQEGRVGLSVLDGGSRRSSNAVIPAQVGSNSSHGATRRGSAPSIHPHALAMRRESSNPVVPSPLRPVEQSLQARSIQKKSSFPFTTSGSPLRAGESPVSPGKRPLYISPSVSPRSADPGTMMNPSTSLGDTPSNSQLRHQVSVSHSPGFESEEEGGPPELAPSVISDSASSEGQFLESPPIAIVPSSRSESTRALPKAPDPGGYIIKSTSETWTPPEHPLHTSINLVHNPNRAHAEPDPPPDSPGSSTHSVLPSVRSKIAQLETRDEALRKFSVSGASTQTPTPERPTATKRRSYTAALAPRPVRSASDDLDERERLGGTTFVNRKSYAEQQTMVYSPRDRDFGVAGGVLRRTGSANSTNTLTTVIGTAAHSDWNGRDLGSARSRMLGNSNVRGYTGVFNSDDRDDQRDYYALTDPREVMRRVSGVDEETDDSEGLL